VPGLIAHPDVPGPLSTVDAERQANQHWATWAYLRVAVVVGLLAGLLAVAFSWAAALALWLLVGVGVFLLIRQQAPKAVLRIVGAAPVADGQLPRVETLLEGVSTTVGVGIPELRILLDDVPNAAALWSPQGPCIVLTTGLVNRLGVIELEGVLGHLLAHQRLGSNERGTKGAGVALLGGPLTRRPARSQRLIGPGRLLRADEVGVLATRYPPGLASALAAMEAGPEPSSSSFFASEYFDTLRWLFVDPSLGRRSTQDATGDLDATAVRRSVLEEA
jgi:Zn-dependent protease with chaperone function